MKPIKTQANLGNRIGATLIDYTLYFIITGIYVVTFGESTEGGYEVTGFMAFIPIVFWFLYFPLIESVNGQTLGHKITGLQVISKNGNPVNLSQAIKRRVIDPIDIFAFAGIPALISINNSDHHQRLGDTFAKTIVIGKNTTVCTHCMQEVTLDAEDKRNGSFNCPYCSEQNDIN